MTSTELRNKYYEQFKNIPYNCENIPCVPKNRTDILPSDKRCPKCGNRMMEVYLSSDAYYWQNMCGRAGRADACSDCGEYYNFQLMRMN